MQYARTLFWSKFGSWCSGTVGSLSTSARRMIRTTSVAFGKWGLPATHGECKVSQKHPHQAQLTLTVVLCPVWQHAGEQRCNVHDQAMTVLHDWVVPSGLSVTNSIVPDLVVIASLHVKVRGKLCETRQPLCNELGRVAFVGPESDVSTSFM